MSAFGALLASGTDNTLLGAPLMECLLEVRVEQTLDQPVRFAMRVREDYFAGQPVAAQAPELKVDRIVSVVVPGNGGYVCLVRGPITESHSQYAPGGAGSFYEVRGSDRRIEMGRQCFQHVWEGRASDAARSILGGSGFDQLDVQDTDRRYGANTNTLNQRGTDLDFLQTMAKENGFFFWLSCSVTGGVAASGGGKMGISEVAHFRTSPFRALGAGGAPASVAAITLAPGGTPVIRAGAGDDCANNVMRFAVKEDVERPNSASATAIDANGNKQERMTTEDPQSPLADGEALTDRTGLHRTLCVTAAGNAEDVRTRAQAALADAGWFVNATASTTAHMLGGVLQPHDIVSVEGVGSGHAGPYRVKKVTHVVTAADHYMDLELQSNRHGT